MLCVGRVSGTSGSCFMFLLVSPECSLPVGLISSTAYSAWAHSFNLCTPYFFFPVQPHTSSTGSWRSCHRVYETKCRVLPSCSSNHTLHNVVGPCGGVCCFSLLAGKMSACPEEGVSISHNEIAANTSLYSTFPSIHTRTETFLWC